MDFGLKELAGFGKIMGEAREQSGRFDRALQEGNRLLLKITHQLDEILRELRKR